MSKLKKAHKEWTDALLAAEALKYSTRGEFQKESCSAYMLCRNRNILDLVCGHMVAKHTKWTKDKIIERANKYTRRVDFQKKDNGAYSSALRKGIVDEVCSHMISPREYRSDAELREIALKYEYRSDFQYYDNGAHLVAGRRGLLEDICSHMEYKDGATRLENEMYMYFIEIKTLDESLPTVWKVGITRFKDVSRRFNREISIARTEIEILKTWYFKKGYNASSKEKEIIERFKEFRYYGDSPLRETKNTEMFTENILDKIEGT